MDRLKVHGFVGLDALQDLHLPSATREGVLKSLRDYVEDRLENEFGVFAELATARDGIVQISTLAPDSAGNNRTMQLFAETCVEEFKTTRIDKI
jgi:hypothetical protein